MTSVLAERSAARPRVCNVPPAVSSAGHEAVELARSAGLVLDPWQADALVDALGERPDGKWSAFEVAVIVARQNGKGAILEARELAGLFLLGEMLILHSAHEYKTAMEAFRRILSLIEGAPDLSREVRKVVNTNGEEGIELRSGARLRFMARSKGSGRGFSADLVIWDEAYALTSAQVEAQLPTLSARPNPQVWYTSSPPLDALTGEVLIRVHERGLAGDPSLCYLDWGAQRGVDLDDRKVWKTTNPAYGLRISEETIARERAALSDEGFSRERLCIWPPSLAEQWMFIPERAWNDACDPQSRRSGEIAIAIEMSLNRQWVSIHVAGKRADGLYHVEVAVSEQGSGWLVQKIVEMRDRLKPCAIVVAGNSPAAAHVPHLEVALKLPIGSVLVEKVEVMSAVDVQQACGGLYDGIAGPEEVGRPSPRTVRHRGQGVLTTAIAGAVTRKTGNTQTWDPHAAVVDISPAMGVAAALWAYRQYGERPDKFVISGNLMG
jgi:hypothetical protein